MIQWKANKHAENYLKTWSPKDERWKRKVWTSALQLDIYRWCSQTTPTWTSSPRMSQSGGHCLCRWCQDPPHLRSHWQSCRRYTEGVDGFNHSQVMQHHIIDHINLKSDSPHTSSALDTAGHDGFYKGANIFIFHCSFALCKAASVAAKLHGLVLQRKHRFILGMR